MTLLVSFCCLNNNMKNVFFAEELWYSGGEIEEQFVACSVLKNFLFVIFQTLTLTINFLFVQQYRF